MALPKDPYILLSYLNTQLRDKYASLAALCDDLEEDQAALEAIMQTKHRRKRIHLTAAIRQPMLFPESSCNSECRQRCRTGKGQLGNGRQDLIQRLKQNP